MNIPTPEQVAAFKAAWHDADDAGHAGKRVEIALAKVLRPAVADGWDEGAEAITEWFAAGHHAANVEPPRNPYETMEV